MRATCPSCEAVYEIPDRLVGTGRRLRCANCGHEWALSPPAADAPATKPEPAAAAALPFRETPEPPPAYEPAQRTVPPPRAVLRRQPRSIEPLPVAETVDPDWRDTAGLRAAWIGSVLLVALTLGSLWAFRHDIAEAWPPAARLTGTPVGGG